MQMATPSFDDRPEVYVFDPLTGKWRLIPSPSECPDPQDDLQETLAELREMLDKQAMIAVWIMLNPPKGGSCLN